MAPSTTLKFSEGEKVLCYHGRMMYEAKILKNRSNPKDNTNEMFIHYAGWSKKWDEWVPEQRVLKYNDANLAKKKELSDKPSVKQVKGKIGKTGRISSGKDKTPDVRDEGSVNDSDSRSSTPVSELKGRIKVERKRASVSPVNEPLSEAKKTKRVKPAAAVKSENKPPVILHLPLQLMPHLIDDHKMVCGKKKLSSLPSKCTVESIIDEFIEYIKSKADENRVNVSRCIMLGIRDYFNILLSSKLLYKEEWSQYNKTMNEYQGKQPCQIYGAFHLLRLFIKLGSVVTLSNINDVSMTLVLEHIEDLVQYLKANDKVYFTSSYYS